MPKQKKKLYTGLIIILLFFAFLYVSIVVPSLKEESQISDSIVSPVKFAPNVLLYDALVQEEKEGRIDFSGKMYPNLGFFVTDIGTLHSGNGKNLIYYINGKEATVGVSSYTLKDGDVIEWKLE